VAIVEENMTSLIYQKSVTFYIFAECY